MIIKELSSEPIYKLLKDKDENNREIKIYKFENVKLTGISKKYPYTLLNINNSNYLTLPINEMTMSTGKKSIYQENGMDFEYKKLELANNIDEEVYFFIYNIENYYHFLYDTLPYLYVYLELKKEKKIKLLMNYDNMLPFVKESLELLGIYDNNIIKYDESSNYKKMYISNSLTHDGMSNKSPRKEIFEIYNKMVNNALKNNNQKVYPNNIYISRRTWINKDNRNIGTNYTTRRKLMNEDTLVENLDKLNFSEFFGENYSMIEKINYFYNSKIIIGAIGGTIANCVFCNENTKIITIVSPDFLNLNYRMKFLFNDQVVLYEDTQLYCKPNTIPPNVRIEIIDENLKEYKQLGEIDSLSDDEYLIKLSNNYHTWKNDDNFKLITLSRNQFKTLDNGINSPYSVNLENLISLTKSII